MEQGFYVSTDGYPHEVGDENCKVEWCGTFDIYPHRCKCGGLIHADWGDEDAESGDYWLYRKCDRCGDDWEFDNPDLTA